VAIVGENVAASLWPGEDAVGKRVKLNFNPAASLPWLEVVGTVGHVKHKGIASESHIQLYLPLAQSTTSTASLVIKSSTPPESLISAVRQAVQEADPDQPLYDVMPLAAHLASTTATTRAAMMMLSVFAAVALLLALVGVYGVMAYSVEQRAHEICLRLALGAEPVSIRRMLLAEASAMVGLGLLAGLLISFLLTPSISGFLYGLTARDPRILLGSALLLLAAGLLATGFPAYKASRRPPTPILR
jgi:putative ABC transport system permease protein